MCRLAPGGSSSSMSCNEAAWAFVPPVRLFFITRAWNLLACVRFSYPYPSAARSACIHPLSGACVTLIQVAVCAGRGKDAPNHLVLGLRSVRRALPMSHSPPGLAAATIPIVLIPICTLKFGTGNGAHTAGQGKGRASLHSRLLAAARRYCAFGGRTLTASWRPIARCSTQNAPIIRSLGVEDRTGTPARLCIVGGPALVPPRAPLHIVLLPSGSNSVPQLSEQPTGERCNQAKQNHTARRAALAGCGRRFWALSPSHPRPGDASRWRRQGGRGADEWCLSCTAARPPPLRSR